VDEEKADVTTSKVNGGVVRSQDGVGDPFTYRQREGRFTIVEWLLQLSLPVFIVLLGACAPFCAGVIL
jgi:hypothetical protein